VISHVEGIRANGTVPYFKSWVPPSPPALKPFLIVLEVLSQFLRIVSLSVRLFANMLAGHLLIIMCVGFVILLSNIWIFPLTITAATFFYIFELGLVASLQAYIFAMLSGIYIGTAIEPDH
jgi:F-type H+-transporting ATPase subunit a